MADASWLDELLGVPQFYVDGTHANPSPRRRAAIGLVSGGGISIAFEDDPEATDSSGVNQPRTNFTISGTGVARVFDEGSELEEFGPLNFIGNAVSASWNAGTGRVDVEITSGDATSIGGIELDTEAFALPDDGDVIVYDAGTGKLTLQEGGSGDATSLQAVPLDAATVGAPNDGDVIVFDAIAGAYKAASPGSLGLPSGNEHDILIYDGADWTPGLIADDNVANNAAISGLKVSPDFGSQAIVTTGEISLGAAPAQVGHVRLPRDAGIWARNADDDDDVQIIALDTDALLVGDENNVGVAYSSGGNHTFLRGSTTMAVVGDRQLRVPVESTSGLGWDFGVKSSYHDNESTGAHVVLEKSRGTAASPAGLSNGDQIGVVWFSPYNEDDSAYDLTAGVRARVEGVPSAGSVPTKIELLAGETLSGLWSVFSGGSDAVAITVNDPSATLGFFLDATTHAAALAGQHYALGDQPASWQSSVGAAWIDGVTTPPSAVESDGAFLWSDASTSELRTHRMRVDQFNGNAWPDTAASGDAGKVFGVSAAATAAYRYVNVNVPVMFSALNVLNGTSFLSRRDGNGNALTTETGGGYTAEANDVLVALRGRHETASGTSENLTYTVRVNGVDTALAVTLNSDTAGATAIDTDSIALSTGDVVTVKCAGASGTRAVTAVVDVFVRKRATLDA